MAMLRVPYNNAMRLGQGVNSFTQQLCMLNAVLPADDEDSTDGDANDKAYDPPAVGISQAVSYNSRFVDKVSDVAHDMNVSAALSVKTGGFEGNGSGKYVNTDSFKESDLNYMVQVKVTNQEHSSAQYTKFNEIPGLRSTEFQNVYGDCFISGWEEGGEFNALISIKLSDKSQQTHISGKLQASVRGGVISGEAEGSFDDTLSKSDAETTITVNWTGGGQLKDVDELWSVETMTKAAASFPDLVAMTPERKYAILTKYTQLPDFQRLSNKYTPLDYENAMLYSSSLLEFYSDYKTIWKNLQVIDEMLQDDPFGVKLSTIALPTEITSYLGSLSISNEVSQPSQLIGPSLTLQLSQQNPPPTPPKYASFGPSILGVVRARHDCRIEMARIVAEVDAVTLTPSIAGDATRKQPFLHPTLFSMLCPKLADQNIFYYGDARSLPLDAQQSIADLSTRRVNWRMTEPWDGGSTNTATDVYFNDMIPLEDGERAIAVRFGMNATTIVSVATLHNTGRVCNHEGGSTRPSSGVTFSGWTLNTPVTSVQIVGQAGQSRVTVADISLRNQEKAMHTMAPSASIAGPTAHQLSAPIGWEFAGFWGYKSTFTPSSTDWPGFFRLGAIWTQTKSVTLPKTLPLYDDAVKNTLPSDLVNMLQPEMNLGRWIRLTNLNNTTRNPGNVFANWLGSDYGTRGLFPGHLSFYFGTGDWVDVLRDIKIWRPTVGDQFYPVRASPPPGNPSIELDLLGGRHKSIESVKIWAKTIRQFPGAKTCCLEITHKISGVTNPFVVGKIPLPTESATSMISARPSPLDNQPWYFAGFYGASGDLIDNLGIVWAREDMYMFN